MDVELRIWKANCKVILEFLPAAWGWRPNPCIVQGSAVLSESRCIIITFKNRETEIQREENRTNEENFEEKRLWRNYNFMNKPEKVCEKHTGINDQVCKRRNKWQVVVMEIWMARGAIFSMIIFKFYSSLFGTLFYWVICSVDNLKLTLCCVCYLNIQQGWLLSVHAFTTLCYISKLWWGRSQMLALLNVLSRQLLLFSH